MSQLGYDVLYDVFSVNPPTSQMWSMRYGTSRTPTRVNHNHANYRNTANSRRNRRVRNTIPYIEPVHMTDILTRASRMRSQPVIDHWGALMGLAEAVPNWLRRAMRPFAHAVKSFFVAKLPTPRHTATWRDVYGVLIVEENTTYKVFIIPRRPPPIEAVGIQDQDSSVHAAVNLAATVLLPARLTTIQMAVGRYSRARNQFVFTAAEGEFSSHTASAFKRRLKRLTGWRPRTLRQLRG